MKSCRVVSRVISSSESARGGRRAGSREHALKDARTAHNAARWIFPVADATDLPECSPSLRSEAIHRRLIGHHPFKEDGGDVSPPFMRTIAHVIHAAPFEAEGHAGVSLS